MTGHLLAVLLQVLLGVVFQQVPTTLSVCEVLSNPGVYHGKIVSVRGEFSVGLELAALRPHDCSVKVTTEGRPEPWPPAIWLTPPGVWGAEPVDFQVDSHAMSALRKLVADVEKDRLEGTIVVTFVGRVESKIRVVTFRTGKKEFLGYGHLGGFPAMLVYKSTNDPVFVPTRED